MLADQEVQNAALSNSALIQAQGSAQVFASVATLVSHVGLLANHDCHEKVTIIAIAISKSDCKREEVLKDMFGGLVVSHDVEGVIRGTIFRALSDLGLTDLCDMHTRKYAKSIAEVLKKHWDSREGKLYMKNEGDFFKNIIYTIAKITLTDLMKNERWSSSPSEPLRYLSYGVFKNRVKEVKAILDVEEHDVVNEKLPSDAGEWRGWSLLSYAVRDNLFEMMQCLFFHWRKHNPRVSIESLGIGKGIWQRYDLIEFSETCKYENPVEHGLHHLGLFAPPVRFFTWIFDKHVERQETHNFLKREREAEEGNPDIQVVVKRCAV